MAFVNDWKLDLAGAEISVLLELLNDDLFVGGLSRQTYEAVSEASAGI